VHPGTLGLSSCLPNRVYPSDAVTDKNPFTSDSLDNYGVWLVLFAIGALFATWSLIIFYEARTTATPGVS
jgi:hypothetical protein